MNGYSQTPQEERIEILRSLMPEVFDEGKIDWEKLKAALGENIDFANERYVLNWAGKSDAFREMQRPTAATLMPCRDESVDFDHTGNIFIEGDNLDVLKVLQKSYFGRVKMIYIDPPYNTGNDSFIYPDHFAESREEYLRRVGDKDSGGLMTREGAFRRNSRENGQYHSNWLSMMMPRLYLAKSLLRDDGVIFISIDDNEVHNLRLLMNEIFGEENFIADIIWEKRFTRNNDAKLMSSLYDHNLLYRKSEAVGILREKRSKKSDSIYSNPDNDPRGVWTSVSYVSQRTKEQRPNLSYEIINPFTKEKVTHNVNAWKYSYEQYINHVKENRLWWGQNGTNSYPRLKRFLSELGEGVVPVNLWDYESTGTLDDGTKEVNALLGKDIFDYPKPHSLIKRMLEMGTQKDSIVLDFFCGSGTTAHAVMQLNHEDGGSRRFICVQLPEPCDAKSEAAKAGYKTIADIARERIRRAGAKIRAKAEAERAKKAGEIDFDGENAAKVALPDTGFKAFRLAESNFKQWCDARPADADELRQRTLEFIDPVADHATIDGMVYELALKCGKGLNCTIVHNSAGYHAINGNELILMLENATRETIDAVIACRPAAVIALDRLFDGNDQLKTNTALQMRDAGINFKTI